MDAGIVSVQVVEAALLGVAQRFVRSANINEFLRRYILVVRVVVRVPLYSELAVGVPARRKGKPAPPVLLVRCGSSDGALTLSLARLRCDRARGCGMDPVPRAQSNGASAARRIAR